MFRVILSCLFLAALWSPAGKAILYVMFACFCLSLYHIIHLDQVWYSKTACFLLSFCVSCHTVLSVPCSLVVTCWERADLLTLLYVMFSCVLSFFIWYPGSGVIFEKRVAFCYLCFVSYCLVCSLQLCGHMLGRFSRI